MMQGLGSVVSIWQYVCMLQEKLSLKAPYGVIAAERGFGDSSMKSENQHTNTNITRRATHLP
jgi:hypothetical protein